MNENMDTIPPDGLTEPVPHEETNGHAVKPRRRGTPRALVATLEQTDTPLEHPATIAFRQLQKDIEAAQLRVAELTGIRDSLLGEATRPTHITASFTPTMTTEDIKVLISESSPKPRKPAHAKSGRKPRDNSVPQRVLGALKSGLDNAASIAQALELEPKLVHSGLHQLLKAGKVKSKGARKNRVWSVKP